MIKRKYFKELENEFNFEEISVLIGSRRVGKTTIMEYLFEKVRDKAVFLSFDSIDVLNLFENNEKLFKEQYVDSHEIIFIDEIQYAKNSGRILKYLFDSTKKKFVVSGSSTPEISLNSLSYLVGRVRIINIFPLNFIEFVTFKNPEKKILFNKLRKLKDVLQLKDNFEQYIKYGGYPRIATLPLMEKEKALNLVETKRDAFNTGYGKEYPVQIIKLCKGCIEGLNHHYPYIVPIEVKEVSQEKCANTKL